jgi:hypothetical protein
MGIAVRMYADDNKAYPYHFFSPDGSNALFWEQALQPYYQLNYTNPAYHCPTYNGIVDSRSSGGGVFLLSSYSVTVQVFSFNWQAI